MLGSSFSESGQLLHNANNDSDCATHLTLMTSISGACYNFQSFRCVAGGRAPCFVGASWGQWRAITLSLIDPPTSGMTKALEVSPKRALASIDSDKSYRFGNHLASCMGIQAFFIPLCFLSYRRYYPSRRLPLFVYAINLIWRLSNQPLPPPPSFVETCF